MSIYCTTFSLGYEHSNRCAKIRRAGRGVYEQDDSKPCTCGSSPIRYQHSGILPSNRDARDGYLDLGAIPPHISRKGRDSRPENLGWHKWLRVGMGNGRKHLTVILGRKQVEKLRDSLTEWLSASQPGKETR